MEWRDIPNWEGLYRISDTGLVYSVRRNKILNPGVSGRGYLRFNMHRNGVRTYAEVHRLVAEIFIGHVDGAVTRHKDGNRFNNSVDNLEWGTYSENTVDSVNHGTHYQAAKTHCKYGHEFSPENTYVSYPKRGGTMRTCKTCRRNRVKAKAE